MSDASRVDRSEVAISFWLYNVGEKKASKVHMLWFEKLCGALGLPFLVGVAVLGYGPILAVMLAEYFLLGLWGEYLALVSNPLSDFFTVALSLVGARYASRRIENLRMYAETMYVDVKRLELNHLYSSRPVIVLWVVLAVLIGLSFASAYTQTPVHVFFLVDNLPFYYFDLIFATFLWTWGYSMYSIYRMGRLPLKLKQFTEDRSLGLRPFATASLNITGIYLLLVSSALFFSILGGFGTFSILFPFLVLLVLGPVFFMLPLVGLRGQLLRAKRSLSEAVGQRYTRVMNLLDVSGREPIDGVVAGELVAIDKIQRDVQQIRGWPFDTGILVRLTALVLSVVAIILARVVANNLGL